jgi:predicted helicase
MRQMFRCDFDRIYLLDLHGDGRAPLPAGVGVDQNVFDIQVGVAIAVCVADGSWGEAEAEVFYAEEWGTRDSKEEWLNLFPANLPLDRFEPVPGTGQDPFYPAMGTDFLTYPDVPAIFLKKFSGVETKRDQLVVAVTRQELERKITRFISAPPYQQVLFN